MTEVAGGRNHGDCDADGGELRWLVEVVCDDLAAGVPTTTDQLAEGMTNLYFTAARVLATALAGFNGNMTGAVTGNGQRAEGIRKLQNRLATVEDAMASPSQALFAEGVIAVPSGASSGTLNGLALAFTPSKVLLTVSILSAGRSLGGGGGQPKHDGICLEVDGGATTAGYQIFYRKPGTSRVKEQAEYESTKAPRRENMKREKTITGTREACSYAA